MSKFVLDASVALKWVLQEPDRQKALDLRDDFRRGIHEFHAPEIFPVEIGHVFSKMHRQRKLSETDAEAYLAEVLSTPPQLHPILPLMPRAYKLSLQNRKALYDCLYLALAEQESCSVVTADRGMVVNPRSSLVLHVSDL